MTVPKTAKQTREVPPRWEWTEPSVWTNRMLTALEKGVKGGVWFSLIDKVYDKRNLESSFRKVKQNKGRAGADHITIRKFEQRLEENIDKLHRSLMENRYNPQKILRVEIPKSEGKGKRPLGIPTVGDRIVQTSLRNVIEPIYEKTFSESSYGFRPGRGCKDALREVDKMLKEGYLFVVDADIKSYFENIDHEILLKEIEEQVADGRVIKLITQFLRQEILMDMKRWIPERGSPQGGVMSPLLSNIYLNKFDHQMRAKGHKLIRYADDFIVMSKHEQKAQEALTEIQRWMETRRLELHPEKTRIVNMEIPGNGFSFLGYWFARTKQSKRLKHWANNKSMKRIREKIKVHTKRCNGKSLEEIINYINPILKGWYEYYKHSPKSTLIEIDGWVRMRLRSILRKRNGGKGRGRGRDNRRWPNIFFSNKGLFSLLTARRIARQSSRR